MMDTLKRFGKYLLILIAFWIFSDILIYAGINSTYKDLQRRGDLPEGIQVVQMQSTKVNGRINLQINNKELSGKYLKIDLYSNLGNVLGTKYIEIGNIGENQIKDIETYFKISDVKEYEISVVDEVGETTEGFMDTALTTMSVLVLVIKLLFI